MPSVYPHRLHRQETGGLGHPRYACRCTACLNPGTPGPSKPSSQTRTTTNVDIPDDVLAILDWIAGRPPPPPVPFTAEWWAGGYGEAFLASKQAAEINNANRYRFNTAQAWRKWQPTNHNGFAP